MHLVAKTAPFLAVLQVLNDTHGVHKCTLAGAEHIVWQGDASRDTYDGTLNGLASTLLTLKHVLAEAATEAATEAAGGISGELVAATAAQLAVAQAIFERVYDALVLDKFWIVPPPTCSHPGGRAQPHCSRINPTPSMQAAWMRVALSANPEKYDTVSARLRYAEVVRLALGEEQITKIHSSAYYGNNLMAQVSATAFFLCLPLRFHVLLVFAAFRSLTERCCDGTALVPDCPVRSGRVDHLCAFREAQGQDAAAARRLRPAPPGKLPSVHGCRAQPQRGRQPPRPHRRGLPLGLWLRPEPLESGRPGGNAAAFLSLAFRCVSTVLTA